MVALNIAIQSNRWIILSEMRKLPVLSAHLKFREESDSRRREVWEVENSWIDSLLFWVLQGISFHRSAEPPNPSPLSSSDLSVPGRACHLREQPDEALSASLDTGMTEAGFSHPGKKPQSLQGKQTSSPTLPVSLHALLSGSSFSLCPNAPLPPALVPCTIGLIGE